MPEKNAEATRRRLIDAARAEFAQHGIAGARVDRIAATANANKAQIYHYFGSKDRLFDAVWEALVEQIVEAVPLDGEDLAGYAARLSDTYARHPDLMRLITWQRLERGNDAPNGYAMQSIKRNIRAIAGAQAQGQVSDHFDAPVLFALIIHVAALWGMSSPDVLAAVKPGGARQRQEIVRTAVAMLLA